MLIELSRDHDREYRTRDLGREAARQDQQERARLLRDRSRTLRATCRRLHTRCELLRESRTPGPLVIRSREDELDLRPRDSVRGMHNAP